MKKLLFICEANKLRSPTAEAICNDLPGIEAKSAGMSAAADKPVNKELVGWADIVFVMERRQRNRLHKLIGDLYNHKRIVCLYVPDEYEYMDPLLISLLKQRLREHLGNVFENTSNQDG